MARYNERLSALERTVERPVRPISKRLDDIEVRLEELAEAMALLSSRQAELSALLVNRVEAGENEE